MNFGRRILILVPHPDDEIVGFCAAILRAKKAGAQIFALFLTHGCVARETMWPWARKNYDRDVARRLCEAEDVAALLQITPIKFVERPARHLWLCPKDVTKEIYQAAHDYQIDQIWIPAYEGGNADHDGLNIICGKMKDYLPPIIEFAEYNYFNKKTMAQSFPHPNGQENLFLLSPVERQIKIECLTLYASEQKNLGYVGLQRETARPLADYDYSSPPHKGTLWYARFQWVPFKHPRVDFTIPQSVCDRLSSFEPATVLPETAKKQAPEYRATSHGNDE